MSHKGDSSGSAKAGIRVVAVYRYERGDRLELPLFLSPVSAGFPSPAEDFVDLKLDINDYLIRHPEATFLLRVEGNSKIGGGIHSGDILVVDRSLEPTDGSIIVACAENEFIIREIRFVHKRLVLVPEDEGCPLIEVPPEADFRIWGVVTGLVRSFDPPGRRWEHQSGTK